MGRGAGCTVDDLGFEGRLFGWIVGLFGRAVDWRPGAEEYFGRLFGNNFPAVGINVERLIGAADFHFRAA